MLLISNQNPPSISTLNSPGHVWTSSLSCRTLREADFSGLGEEEDLSLKLLIQAQGLLTASRTASPSQKEAQQHWQAFASLQSSGSANTPDGQHSSATSQQQRNQMLYQRLQHASAAAGWHTPLPHVTLLGATTTAACIQDALRMLE